MTSTAQAEPIELLADDDGSEYVDEGHYKDEFRLDAVKDAKKQLDDYSKDGTISFDEEYLKVRRGASSPAPFKFL